MVITASMTRRSVIIHRLKKEEELVLLPENLTSDGTVILSPGN
jgi:hypothetical protein